MLKLSVVRGFVGSGRTTLAHQLAKGGCVLSLDNYLTASAPGKDIISSHQLERANGTLRAMVEAEINLQTPNIVVDTIGAKLWEIRDYWDMARTRGYEVALQTPSTPWARDPEECERRTKYKLCPESWAKLIQAWEGPATVAAIDESLTPDEKLFGAQWVSLYASQAPDPKTRYERQRFLSDNFKEENSRLQTTGFLGPNGAPLKEAFALHMKSHGLEAPKLIETPLPNPSRTLDELEAEIARRQKNAKSIEF